MDIKTVEELRKEQNDRRFKEFQRGIESYEKRTKLLQKVHDIRDVINWFLSFSVVLYCACKAELSLSAIKFTASISGWIIFTIPLKTPGFPNTIYSTPGV